MTSTESILEKFVKNLEESLIDHLKGEVKKMVKDTIQIHIDGLNKRFDSISRTMDMWKTDFDGDRETIQGLRIDSGNMKTEMIEIRKVIDGLPKKMERKVQQTVNDSVSESVPQAVSETFDITKKKIKVTEKERKKFLGLF